MEYILQNAVEPIQFLATDVSNAPLTGLADLLITIRRASDNMFLDFADATFKAAGWGSKTQALAEVSAADAPGWYAYAWNTALVTNPVPAGDTYYVTITQTGATCKNVPAAGEVRTGSWTARLDAAVSTRAAPGAQMALTAGAQAAAVTAVWSEPVPGAFAAGSAGAKLSDADTRAILIEKIARNRLELSAGSANNWVLYDDDSITPLLTFDVTDKTGGAIVIAASAPARRSRGA